MRIEVQKGIDRMLGETCPHCGNVVWRSQEFCSHCGIATAATDELSELFGEASEAAPTKRKKCPRCGWNCRCVSVLFLYDRQQPLDAV